MKRDAKAALQSAAKLVVGYAASSMTVTSEEVGWKGRSNSGEMPSPEHEVMKAVSEKAAQI